MARTDRTDLTERGCEVAGRDLDTVEFRVTTDPGSPTTVAPVVGAVPLTELVATYEHAQGYAPAGGYGALVPGYFRFGDLRSYLHGDGPAGAFRPGTVWLLACGCGEAGCWPLEATVDATDDTVTWSGFRQPHRPSWTYDGFGPFTFDRAQYDTAAAEAAAALGGGGS